MPWSWFHSSGVLLSVHRKYPASPRQIDTGWLLEGSRAPHSMGSRSKRGPPLSRRQTLFALPITSMKPLAIPDNSRRNAPGPTSSKRRVISSLAFRTSNHAIFMVGVLVQLLLSLDCCAEDAVWAKGDVSPERENE